MMNVTIELRNTSYIVTPVNQDYIGVLTELFPFTLIASNQVEFDGLPVTVQKETLGQFHALISDLGICTVRATDDGFYIILGE